MDDSCPGCSAARQLRLLGLSKCAARCTADPEPPQKDSFLGGPARDTVMYKVIPILDTSLICTSNEWYQARPYHSFDDVVCADEQRGRCIEANSLCCLQVQHRFILRWRLNRQVGGFVSSQDTINVRCSLFEIDRLDRCCMTSGRRSWQKCGKDRPRARGAGSPVR
jgi:hypothetical protein